MFLNIFPLIFAFTKHKAERICKITKKNVQNNNINTTETALTHHPLYFVAKNIHFCQYCHNTHLFT